ncbi:hypothetical protein VUR80DRAFT_4571 [Thermomyces stellatus]
MSDSRNKKGGSWVSRLPSRLKLLFYPPDEGQPERPFRMTHFPDRPARDPISPQNIPTDEECLRYLLAVQQQGMNFPGRAPSSVYSWQEDSTLPSPHGVGGSGRGFTPLVAGHATRSPRHNTERVPEWDVVVARSTSPPFTPDSLDTKDSWDLPLWEHYTSEAEIRSSSIFPSNCYSADKKGLTEHSLTRETWPASEPRHDADTSRSKGVQSLVHPDDTLPPPLEAQGDSGSDDVYEGWAEYYFDEANFQDRDQQGRYTGGTSSHTRLPSIEEFI